VLCRGDDSRLKDVKGKAEGLRIQVEVPGRWREVVRLALGPVDEVDLRRSDTVTGLAEEVPARQTRPEVAAIRERRVTDVSGFTAKGQAGVGR
jgi:hypothetical protein